MANSKLDSILSDFIKPITKLEKFITKNSDQIVDNSTEIGKLKDTNKTLQEDNEKASIVLVNFKDLLGI